MESARGREGQVAVLVTASVRPLRRALLLIGPLILLAAVVWAVLATNPVASLRGDVVPVEDLGVESVRLTTDRIEMRIRNTSSTTITVAQVLVNEAYWNHEVSDRELDRLESAAVTIVYPWERGLPLRLTFLTAAGSRIEHEIPVALPSPSRSLRATSQYAGLGLLIGVVPVAVGLLWYPALRSLTRRFRIAILAFTAGLLAFLLVDTLQEGLEIAFLAGDALDAVGLLVIGAATMIAALVLAEDLIASRRRSAREAADGRGETADMTVVYLLALAIGLHNLGEGLAVSTAVAVGEVALGTTMLLGFILHNSTEGLAIAMPIDVRRRLGVLHFGGLALVAGAPAIIGTVVGSWSVAPAWIALAFGAAAGALLQVMWLLRPGLAGSVHHRGLVAVGFTTGLVVMYGTGLLTA